MNKSEIRVFEGLVEELRFLACEAPAEGKSAIAKAEAHDIVAREIGFTLREIRKGREAPDERWVLRRVLRST